MPIGIYKVTDGTGVNLVNFVNKQKEKSSRDKNAPLLGRFFLNKTQIQTLIPYEQ